MNISTQLTHFDENLAICMVTLKDGDACVSVYASALSSESALHADIAQKRAVELAINFLNKGGDAFQELTFSPQPFLVTPSAHMVANHSRLMVDPSSPTTLVEDTSSRSPTQSQTVSPETNDSTGSEELDVAPW